MAKEDAFGILAGIIAEGLALETEGKDSRIKAALDGLFETRYISRTKPRDCFRDAYGLKDGGVPWAGVIAPENPTSGAYGGASLAWFPVSDGVLMTLVVGTKGLAPDEGLLTRNGHRRRVSALRHWLAARGIRSWSKSDPASISSSIPDVARRLFPECQSVFDRYGDVIYSAAWIPKGDVAGSSTVVQAYLDLYGRERGWQVRVAYQPEVDGFLSDLKRGLFPRVTPEDMNALLRERRFVVLQGPPGTGKTRMAERVKDECFGGRGRIVQFHPAITYEDFIIGLAPDPTADALRFRVKPGWLLQAAAESGDAPYLLIVDEINRGDLAKVLGEAIYLFEPGEIAAGRGRHIQLPHAIAGLAEFRMPANLYVLATMNTADRSIAGLDLAIRRRFAFVTLMPDVAVATLPSARRLMEALVDVFVEHASDEALHLLPGHAYFLAPDDATFRNRLRYDLLPLIDEYLRQNLLGSATSDLHAVREQYADYLAGE